VLLGRAPQGFGIEARSLAALAVPQVSPGLPAGLLVRRPDLAAAEAQLAAANADLSAARAALLPSIRLTGSAGVASGALIAVLSGPTASAALAASILQPIFDGGRLRGQVAIAESREREIAHGYRRAILTAFADVEQALAAASGCRAKRRRARRRRCGSRRYATAREPTICYRCSMRSARCSARRTSLRRSVRRGSKPPWRSTRRSAAAGK
jgi:outer membrane protein TolC